MQHRFLSVSIPSAFFRITLQTASITLVVLGVASLVERTQSRAFRRRAALFLKPPTLAEQQVEWLVNHVGLWNAELPLTDDEYVKVDDNAFFETFPSQSTRMDEVLHLK